LSACSGGGSSGGGEGECPEASAGFLSSLQSGFKGAWKGADVTRSGYVDTGKTWINDKEIFSVAVDVMGDTGVFGTDENPTGSGGGLIIAANKAARQNSTWGTAAAPGSPISQSFADPADVAEAEACLT
jgi:hypothetical protein